MMIRTATDSDIAAITAIYRDAVLHGTGTFETDPPDAVEMAARCARITSAGYPYLVAVEAGGVVGYAHVAAFRERQAFGFAVEDSVYVRRDARGRGIGRALLAALVETATRRGYRQMLALIGDSANIGSIALHAGAGFTHCGVLRAAGWKAGRWLDVVVMQLALGEGARTPPDRGPGPFT